MVSLKQKWTKYATEELLKCDNCGELLRGYIVKRKGCITTSATATKDVAATKSAKDLPTHFRKCLVTVA